jgi:hypothetical protein
MNFSYSAVWDDTTRLLRSHSSLISAVAGVFVFLPMLLVAYFLPEPNEQGRKMMEALIDYYSANSLWLLLQRLVQMIGSAAIFLLLSARGSPTVRNVIATAASILPIYFITVVISNLIIGAGFALFLVPGLYLLGRLGPAGVVVADRGRHALRPSRPEARHRSLRGANTRATWIRPVRTGAGTVPDPGSSMA